MKHSCDGARPSSKIPFGLGSDLLLENASITEGEKLGRRLLFSSLFLDLFSGLLSELLGKLPSKLLSGLLSAPVNGLFRRLLREQFRELFCGLVRALLRALRCSRASALFLLIRIRIRWDIKAVPLDDRLALVEQI